MNYPSKHCWPDTLDYSGVLSQFFGSEKSVSVENTYQDFRTAYEWLSLAVDSIHSHGKHQYKSLAEVKAIAEGFIGRRLSADAFRAAAFIVLGDRHLKDLSHDPDNLLVKVPPFDMEHIGAEWEQHVRDVGAALVSNVGER